MYLEPLFYHLRSSGFKGITDFDFTRIQKIIGRNLSPSLTKTTWPWSNYYIKRSLNFYNIRVLAVNPIGQYVRFKII